MCYHSGINIPNLMDDEYLTRCVVDPLKRKLYLYSSEGDEKTVDCETMDQFMSVSLIVLFSLLRSYRSVNMRRNSSLCLLLVTASFSR